MHGIFLGCILCLWELLVRKGMVNPFYVGSPSGIWTAGAGMLRSGELTSNAYVSVRNLLVGFLSGVTAGALVGITVGHSSRLYGNLKGYLRFFYTVPQLVVIPFLIIWLGVGDASKVLIIFLMTFFPVVIVAMEAARAVPVELEDLFRVYGAGRLFTLTRLVLPASSRAIAAGAKVSVSRAVAGMILGETFGQAAGLGYLLFRYGAVYSVTHMLAVLAVIMAVSGGLFYSLDLAEKRLIRWR